MEISEKNETSEKETNEIFFGVVETPEEDIERLEVVTDRYISCLLYTSPSPRDRTRSRMPSSA